MKILLSLAFCFVTINSTCQSSIKEVGIPDNQFFAHAQEKTNWCWAASVQMILEYYKIYKTQNEIVERTFGKGYNGEVPNLGGSIQTISSNLNKWDVDYLDRPSEVKSVFYSHPPNSEELIEFLSNKQPIYLSYKSGLSTNHAIVITGCNYTQDANNRKVTEITVRDPWPSPENVRSDGLIVYDYDDFFPLMNYFWIVSVRTKGNVYSSASLLNTCGLPFCVSLKQVLSGFADDFKRIRTDKLGDAEHTYRSNVSFPLQRSAHLSTGKFPYYYGTFYRGKNIDSANFIYEDLKANFQFLEIKLEEVERSSESTQNKTTSIHLDNDKVITLAWRRYFQESNYTITMKISTEADPLK